MINIDELLNLLSNVEPQKDGSWKARCPAHNDGTHKGQQSLNIKLDGDKILLHCFAGCDTSKIVQTLGLKMSDLFIDKPEKPEKKTRSGNGKQKIIEKIYPYYDLSGNTILHETIRYEGKIFTQRRPDGKGGYIYNLKNIEPVIYRLPQITSAIARGETIFHTEGEKDADNLVKIGLEATTSPMGAKSWRDSYSTFYTGAAQLIILSDKDEPGRAYAQQVALATYSKVKVIKIIEMPGDKIKDISDWLIAGGSRGELDKIVMDAPIWQPPKLDMTMIDYGSTNQMLQKASDGQYCILNGGFNRIVYTREGEQKEIPFTSFVARITEDILKDNGEDSSRFLKIQGRQNGSCFPTITIPESNFDGMKWVRKEWGVKARMVAGKGNNDHIVNAIIYSSEKVKERILYTHTGWRRINDKMVYLTSGGAIGAPEIEVDLPQRLSRYSLPQPDGDPCEAIQKALSILDIAQLKITLPTLILPFLAVLNVFEEISFTPWYLGRSGSLKSVMTALATSFFGHFTHKTLPVNWFGTRTELEKLSFMAKDILFPVDDYAPPTDANSARKINETVEYMIRDAGNRQGRVRSNADLTSQTTFYPRGLMVTSGEQLPPPGVSRSARILPIPISLSDFIADDVGTYDRLTEAQHNQRFYPIAMAHFIKWLQDDFDARKIEFHKQYLIYREKTEKKNKHLRMVETIALMQTGLKIFSDFALDKKAIQSSTHDCLLTDGWDIFSDLISAQSSRITTERPGVRFIEVLQNLLASGKAILRKKYYEAGIQTPQWIPNNAPPGTNIIGWDNGDVIHVIATDSYKAVFNYCGNIGEHFGTHRDETWKDLKELDYLVEDEKDDPAALKYIPGANMQRVLNLKRSILFPENFAQ